MLILVTWNNHLWEAESVKITTTLTIIIMDTVNSQYQLPIQTISVLLLGLDKNIVIMLLS